MICLFSLLLSCLNISAGVQDRGRKLLFFELILHALYSSSGRKYPDKHKISPKRANKLNKGVLHLVNLRAADHLNLHAVRYMALNHVSW